MAPKPPFTDLFHMTGQTPYSVEQNILKLRDTHDQLQQTVASIQATLANLPTIYSLKQIKDALSPTGSNPLPTASLLNTTPPPSSPVEQPPTTPVDDGIPSHLDQVNAVYATN